MIFETVEMKLRREKKARDERIRKRMESGRLVKMSDTTVAYNVDDTSDEKPDISGINDWDPPSSSQCNTRCVALC